MALFFFVEGALMVRINENYQFKDEYFENKGYLDVIKEGRTFRFKVLDDGGAASSLSIAKIKEIITNLIENKSLTLFSHSRSRSITIEKEQCAITGLHAPIILKMTNISPFLALIIKFFRERVIEPLFGKKSSLTKHITIEFRKVVSRLPEYLQKKILHDVRITPAEHYSLKFFGALIKNYPDDKKIDFVQEVLQGAYVQINDGGNFYKEWLENVPHKRHRNSSHEASSEQYSFQGPLFKECLFSKKIISDEKGTREVTWFQLERYPLERIYALPHLITWILYKVTGKNQGPHGASVYTEKNPFVLDLPFEGGLAKA